MKFKRIITFMIVSIGLLVTLFGSSMETHAGTQVENCEPYVTAGTPYVYGGEVRATNSVFCQTGVSTGVTFNTTIKVFRKSDHVWLYDTITQSQSCTAPCSIDYDPNLTYNPNNSYYTWVRVTVNGSSQYDTDGSGWLNY